MGRLTDAIKHLLIINILFFIATNIYGDQMYQWFSLWFPENENFSWWQLVSHMFMHGGFMHILFNMYALWAFGTPLERMWGRNKFLFFYFSAGLGAALIHTGVNYYYFNQGIEILVNSGMSESTVMEIISAGKYSPDWYNLAPQSTIDNFLGSYNTPAVGASGAIYGILVAFGMSFPNSELFLIFLPVPIKAKWLIIGAGVISLYLGLSGQGGNVAHFAHLGGMIFGFILIKYWNRFTRNFY